MHRSLQKALAGLRLPTNLTGKIMLIEHVDVPCSSPSKKFERSSVQQEISMDEDDSPLAQVS